MSVMPYRPEWRRLMLGICVLLISAYSAVAQSTIPIESDKPLAGSLVSGQTKCYQFSLDAAATREVVYWPEAKIYVRLEPCTGLPHLRVSVYGCPSEGNIVNWEYQNERARNDLRANGEPVPAEWEWIGDVETLSIDVTHRNFYIEVSNYYWPLRTNHSMSELGRRLRDAGYSSQAEEVDDIMFVGRMGATEVARLKSFEGLLMPPATYELGVYLHDDAAFPEEQVLPLKRTAGWNRDIVKEDASVLVVGQPDDPYSGNYLITFWPPTRKPNATAAGTTTGEGVASETNASEAAQRRSLEEEWEEELRIGGRLGPQHARRLLELRRQGEAVRWRDVEGMLGAEHAGEVEAARRLLAPEDIILHPDPRYAKEEKAAVEERRALSPAENAARLEEIRAEQEKVKAALEKLKGVEGYAEAVAAGSAKFQEMKEEERQAAETRGVAHGGGRRALLGSLSGNGTMGNYSMVQRWSHPMSDEDLQYMIYWIDLTEAVKARWGTMLDSLGNSYTRLLDEPCDAEMKRCGIAQVIAQEEFASMDADQDGILTKAEFDMAYPANLQADDPGFANGTFEELVGSAAGMERGQFEAQWTGAEAILDASVKDPLLRNHWTVCGLEKTGTPVVPSGNVSLDSRRAEWLSIKSFDQLSDGRLARSLKGLDDSDNNVYAINIIVRNIVTGEKAIYKPHILQRRTPIYKAPEATGPAQMGIIIAASCSIGGIVLIFLIAIWYTRRRKTKPRIRIKKVQD